VSTLRVLHVPDAVGGNPQGLARAERELGLRSKSVVFVPSPFAYEADEVLGGPGVGKTRYLLRRLRLLGAALGNYDVVHFNFGRTLAPARIAYADLPLLRRLGKVIAVTFQGDDARRGDIARARGGRSLPVVLPDLYPPETDQARRARVAAFDRYADLIFYLNPDLAKALPARAAFMPYAHVHPRGQRSAADRPEDGPFVIVHAPTDRRIKGTSFVVAAVEQLQAEGFDVELRLVEGLSNLEANALYGAADLAVDQLHAGWYGGFAVEAMSYEMPVVSFIREDDLDVLDPGMRRDLPVLSASPETLSAVLRDALSSGRAAIRELGTRSADYVATWHNPRTIAADVIARYEAAAAQKGRRRA
jgi:glycosyltransferase involved in cell wall biosynthesis